MVHNNAFRLVAELQLNNGIGQCQGIWVAAPLEGRATKLPHHDLCLVFNQISLTYKLHLIQKCSRA